VDENFKRLIDAIKEVGLYDDSLIIFTSDHGEGMGEHDYYFAHGENLYNILTHVPLIIKYGSVLKGRRADCVQHLDIVPTIRNIVGMKGDSRYRGRDLRFPLKRTPEIFAEMETDTFIDGVKFSLTFDSHKLIYTPIYKQYQFFDLKNDPHESHNLVNDNKYRHYVKDFKERLHRIRRENLIGQKIVNRPPDLSEEEKAKLRSLGYL
jgi:arylsulfatase A-like enzyme